MGDKKKDKLNVLVTGGAGFIGSHLIDRLLAEGHTVTVIDNFNDFYDPSVKRRNVSEHLKHSNYKLFEGDIRQDGDLDLVFGRGPFDVVVHLAAMAGVRPSMLRPALYMDVNVSGTQKILDRIIATRSTCDTRLVFGSSSSVYGNRSGECFRESDRIDQPLSPYAASKVAGEAICYAAHHTTGLDVICLRFFTVFGPRQRPDLAIHKFSKLIENGETVELFGDGSSKRDYTFVSDIVAGIVAAMHCQSSGFEVVNLGRGEPVYLKEMVACIENELGKKARIEHKPVVTGDMPYTYASIDKARELLGYEPKTSFAEGIAKFVAWHRQIACQPAGKK